MRVLIVDDSQVTRILLRGVLEAEGYQVREADSGEQALEVLRVYTPDIVTMDVHMPGMDGYEATEQILARYALPVVVLTASANPYASATAMRALEAGALAVLEKTPGPGAPDFSERIDDLLSTVRSMAQVKIVRRQRKAGAPQRQRHVSLLLAQADEAVPQLIAISASAGGPVAIKSILQGLDVPQPWALVLVQHIAPGFLPSFRDWLATLTDLPIAIAEDAQTLHPGTLYLAPESAHLGFSPNRCVALDGGPPEDHIRPSANYLFRSVAKQFGRQAIGIQLSGMGRDGAEGLLELNRSGALTIVQDPDSAVIDSMPQAAIGLQAARQILSPEAIASLLNVLAKQSVAQGTKGRRE